MIITRDIFTESGLQIHISYVDTQVYIMLLSCYDVKMLFFTRKEDAIKYIQQL